MKEKSFIKISSAIELIGLIAIFVIPVLFGIKSALSVSAIILLVTFSRSTPFSRNMLLGFHSFLTLVGGHMFGWQAGALVGILSTILIWRMSKILGGSYPLPMLTIYDSVYLTALGIFGAFIPVENFVLFGMIGIIVGKYIGGNIVKAFFSPEPLIKHIMLSFLNLSVNYFLLTSFAATVISVFG
ncbi:TPA: hypothetical protein H1005_01910 [archaeon]|uniref:Uncharacterized protein n=1 Tax=Candidatus Naiadarchaeum limnaeum TaxID=2756139 RepID=A0A832X626_9ARCH|nr:hypothetical protein [Candidatus Naiadarchaeales archaeon SRR2090153.bin1042]HIK00425.1 hypothetical protein [Candidatus Naiadarchaeum limnaeum]